MAMLTLEQMIGHFIVALILGALVGIEREYAGKEAGVRTNMLVAGGAALFTMIGLTLPHLIATSSENLPEVIARNSGFLSMIGNIVIGIGFLGGGIIIKTKEHVIGLTTAATIWTTAAIGVLAGLGLIPFAVVSAVLVAGLLYLSRLTKLPSD
jgi:putative Mg2+ transporter-C (MgtC) family protein